jgi:Hypervirulence associated proteins TUDOR domain
MAQQVNIGDTVVWKWGFGLAEGVVVSIEPQRAQIISKVMLITRNGTADNPAIIISHKSGNQVIKLLSELIDPSNRQE